MDLPGLTRMPCVCRHGTVDTQGFHFTSQCPVGNQRFRTHDAIAVTWVALLKEAGFLCRMEDPSCFREVEDTNKRADVVVITGWTVTRASSMCPSHTHGSNLPTVLIEKGEYSIPRRRLAYEKQRRYASMLPNALPGQSSSLSSRSRMVAGDRRRVVFSTFVRTRLRSLRLCPSRLLLHTGVSASLSRFRNT
jgi:hypothetical protein